MNDYIYFSIKDEVTSINFTVTDYEYNYEYDFDKNIDVATKTNVLKCYYNYSDNDGWGSVEDTVPSEDISEFATLFANLINNKRNELKIEKRLFVCEVKRTRTNYHIDFKIGDGLTGTWIQVVKENMSKAEVEILANAVISWAKAFPIPN